MSPLPTIHLLYENPAWLPPVVSGMQAEGFRVELHLVWKGAIDPNEEPAPGIWINRMSPSSHTRGHGESVGLMREMLAWLEGYGRRVVNGGRALELEVSKLRQDQALRRAGIRTPRTVMAIDRADLVRLAATFDGPFITKHNQGGKGLGIHLFQSPDRLADHLDSDEFDPGPNGQIILQEYIVPAGGHITRVEVAAGRFLYAMHSSTAEGFELCPSDACQVPAKGPDVCPADGDDPAGEKFQLADVTADDEIVHKYLALCEAEGLEIAGIEFVEDFDGNRYTYDINGTTNYNSAVANAAGVDGWRELARYLKREVLSQSSAVDLAAS